MNNWDRVQQDNKFRQKLQNIKSTLPKISKNANYPQNKCKINSLTSPPVQTTNYSKQNYVKHLLREFGLSQYLRKIFEFGYDDNNIYKIGSLNQKEFNELLVNLKIFPGHQVKMVNLYEYLRQLNVRSNLKKPNTSSGYNNKSFSSSGENSTQRKILSSKGIKHKSTIPKGLNNTINSTHNNQLVNSFLKGNFGYNYYLNDNKNNKEQNINYKSEESSYGIERAKIDKYDSQKDIKTIKDKDIEEMNEDIDKMLKYYMVQLNEKLDDSYDSIEDSSLSNADISTHSIKNKKKKKNIEDTCEIKTNTHNYSNSGNDINLKRILERKKCSNASKEEIALPKANKSNSNSNTTNTTNVNPISNKCIPIKLPSIQKNNINSTDVKRTPLNQKNLDTNKNKEKGNKEEEKREIKEEKKDKKDEINEDNKEDYSFEKVDNIPEHDILKDEHNQQEKSREQESDILIESVKKEDTNQIEEVLQQTNQKINDLNQEVSNIQQQPPKEEEDKNKYIKEQEIYENLRLTKSSEGDYFRQNMDSFNIEYMCRCLALAILKHIESGKDKSHITELIDLKEEFSFYNSIYNNKIDFIFNFFNKDAKPQEMSNLDRLALEENKKKKIEISFVNHFKQKKDEDLIKETEAKDKLNKIHTNFTDIEKDIKFIDEFFSVGKKRSKNYQGLSEKTKDILNKELSYINEVDNEMTLSKLNNTSSNDQLTTSPENKGKGYENILRQSMQKILNKEAENEKDKDKKIKEDIIDKEDKEQRKEKQTDKNEDSLINNRFTSVNKNDNNEEESYKQTPIMKITEELPPEGLHQKEIFESGEMESNYVIDVSTIEKLKSYLLKQMEIFDDDYYYPVLRIQTRKYVPPPDPQQIFEFCANIMFLTKMEKEVMIITLIYLERLMFNTGLLLTSRNWRRITFTAMIIASKIWDDDSFENNHFAQVFTHLKIGEINLMEKTYLELINYKVYVKCSEYFKYFFIIKSIALKYNFNGMNLVPVSVEKMMKIQEYAYHMQRKVRKRYLLNNSSEF